MGLSNRNVCIPNISMINEDRTIAKNRLLYVDKDYSLGDMGYERDIYIRRELAREYDFTLYRHLRKEIIDYIRQARPGFDAMITNMPYVCGPAYSGYFSKLINVEIAYKRSLNILKEIKKIVDMPIILYTGSGASEANCFFSTVADQIVHKSNNSGQDLQGIRRALKRLLEKYQRLPSQINDPVIKEENGYTTTQVRVDLNEGLNLMSMVEIRKEGKNYRKAIILKASGENGEPGRIYNAKNILDLMMPPEIKEGQNLTICVEGIGEKAQRKIRRLYAALTSRYWFTMDNDRYKKDNTYCQNIIEKV